MTGQQNKRCLTDHTSSSSLLNYVPSVPNVPTCLRAKFSYVPTCHDMLRANVLTCLRAKFSYVPTCHDMLRANVPTCLRAKFPYVPTCHDMLHANVPTCLRAKFPYVPTCHDMSRANVPTCLRAKFSYVPTCHDMLRANVPTCQILFRALLLSHIGFLTSLHSIVPMSQHVTLRYSSKNNFWLRQSPITEDDLNISFYLL